MAICDMLMYACSNEIKRDIIKGSDKTEQITIIIIIIIKKKKFF